MTTDIVPFEQNTELAVPEDVAALFGASNIQSGEAMPALSLKGKAWKIVKDGNETLVTTLIDGEKVAAPTVKIVVLGQTPGRSRTYFKGAFVEGENKAPTCHSYDGVAPASDCDTPQAEKCESCQYSVKGSKITDDNKATTACGVNKMLAVIPSHDLNFDALRLKLPVTSLYDKTNAQEAQGWFAWDQYMKYLASRGVGHTAMVETTMKFDDTAWPKVLFKATGMVGTDGLAITAKRSQDEEVQKILGLDKGHATFNATAASEAPKTVESVAQEAPATGDAAVAPAQTAQTEAPAKTEAPAPVVVDSEDALKDALTDWD